MTSLRRNHKLTMKRSAVLLILFLKAMHLQGATAEMLAKPKIMDHGLPVLGFPFSLSCIPMTLPVQVKESQVAFTWFKDDRELRDKTSVSLTFDSIQNQDAGSYSCRVSLGSPDTASPQSDPFTLTIFIHPNVTIELTTPNSDIQAVLGGSLTLTCVIWEAYPRVLDNGYNWSYRPSSWVEWQSLPDRGRSLTFTNVTREDAGHYRCQARNDAGVEGKIPPGEASAFVEVLYLENIRLTPDLEVNEGEHVTLTCSVESNPPANLTWIVGGQEVRRVTYNVDHYVLERAACSDNKTYTCHASNAGLSDHNLTASTALHVRCSNPDSGEHTSETIAPRSADSEVSALFRIRFPEVDSFFLEHPRGYRIVLWKRPCNFSVCAEFPDRITDIVCNSARELLSFRIMSVTDADEGEYSCKEERSGNVVKDCSQKLVLKECSEYTGVKAGLGVAVVIAVIIIIVVIVVVIVRHKPRRPGQATKREQYNAHYNSPGSLLESPPDSDSAGRYPNEFIKLHRDPEKTEESSDG